MFNNNVFIFKNYFFYINPSKIKLNSLKSIGHLHHQTHSQKHELIIDFDKKKKIPSVQKSTRDRKITIIYRDVVYYR